MVRRTPCASRRRLPQAVNQRGQLIGQRRTVAAPDRPGQLKTAGVQKHALEPGRRRLPVVKLIANQGVVNGRCVNADLVRARSEEHTSELQSRGHLVCRLLLEKKK